MEREGKALKARIATADAHMVQLRERNVGLSTRVGNLNSDLETIRTEVARLNGELTTVRDELTTVRAEAVRCADIREVEQLVTDLAQRVKEANVNSEMSV